MSKILAVEPADSVAPLFESLPRTHWPRIIVQPLEFNASLTQKQLAEMHSIAALGAAIAGGVSSL